MSLTVHIIFIKKQKEIKITYKFAYLSWNLFGYLKNCFQKKLHIPEMLRKHLGFPRKREIEETIFFFLKSILKSCSPIIGNEIRTDHVSYSIYHIYEEKKEKYHMNLHNVFFKRNGDTLSWYFRGWTKKL